MKNIFTLFLILFIIIGIFGCEDWFEDDRNSNTSTGPGGLPTVMINITHSHDHVYTLICFVPGAASVPAYFDFEWQDFRWNSEFADESGRCKFDHDFVRDGTYDLVVWAVDYDGEYVGYLKRAIEIGDGEDPSSDNLNLDAHKKPGGNCDDVELTWSDTGADWYELYQDGIRISRIVNDFDFAYSLDQITPYANYMMIDSEGNEDTDGHYRDCPGD